MTQATFQHKDKQPSDKSDAREFSEGEKKKKWKEECREIKRAQLTGVERGGGWGDKTFFFFFRGTVYAGLFFLFSAPLSLAGNCGGLQA